MRILAVPAQQQRTSFRQVWLFLLAGCLAVAGCSGNQVDPASIPKIPPGGKQMPDPGDENGVGKSSGAVIPAAPPRR